MVGRFIIDLYIRPKDNRDYMVGDLVIPRNQIIDIVTVHTNNYYCRFYEKYNKGYSTSLYS